MGFLDNALNLLLCSEDVELKGGWWKAGLPLSTVTLVHMFTQVHMHTCTHTNTHKHICACTHAHTHIHKHTQPLLLYFCLVNSSVKARPLPPGSVLDLLDQVKLPYHFRPSR